MVRNVQGHVSIAAATGNIGAVDCMFDVQGRLIIAVHCMFESCSRSSCFVLAIFVIIFVLYDCYDC
jgi:hypothetical protein